MLRERPLHAVLRQELQSTLLLLAQYGCVLPRTCLPVPAKTVRHIASKQGTPVQVQRMQKHVEALDESVMNACAESLSSTTAKAANNLL